MYAVSHHQTMHSEHHPYNPMHARPPLTRPAVSCCSVEKGQRCANGGGATSLPGWCRRPQRHPHQCTLSPLLSLSTPTPHYNTPLHYSPKHTSHQHHSHLASHLPTNTSNQHTTMSAPTNNKRALESSSSSATPNNPDSQKKKVRSPPRLSKLTGPSRASTQPRRLPQTRSCPPLSPPPRTPRYPLPRPSSQLATTQGRQVLRDPRTRRTARSFR